MTRLQRKKTHRGNSVEASERRHREDMMRAGETPLRGRAAAWES